MTSRSNQDLLPLVLDLSVAAYFCMLCGEDRLSKRLYVHALQVEMEYRAKQVKDINYVSKYPVTKLQKNSTYGKSKPRKKPRKKGHA